MSISSRHKTAFAALATACALALSGCGGEDDSQSAAPEQRDLSGALSPTAAAEAAPEVRPTDQASEAAPESTDFAPVDVQLEDGGFARGTPKKIRIPSGFIVIVSARADSGGPYKLSVLSPSVAQTFKIPAGGERKITLDSMRPGQTAKLIVGKSTVKISADAEPGP